MSHLEHGLWLKRQIQRDNWRYAEYTLRLKQAIEYRAQVLDQLAAMRDHKLGSTTQYHDLYTVCRDTSSEIFFYTESSVFYHGR